MEPAAPAAAARLDSLTGLRAVAAGLVFTYHLRNMSVLTGAEQTALSSVVDGGSSAVSLFFILSGFVLAWAYRPGFGTTAIWWNRLLRIGPLHLVAFSLALLVGATVYPAIRTSDPIADLANLFLVSAWRADWWQAGNPVSWSLVCEAFFYALFPFLIRFLLRVPRATVVGTAVLSVAATWMLPGVLPVIAPTLSTYSNPLARLPEFVLGLALAVLMQRHGWRGPRLIVAAPIALIGYIVATINAETPYAPAAWTAIGFGLLIAALARSDHEARRSWLSRPVAVFLGERSFAFYLVHLLALQAVIGAEPNLPTVVAADPHLIALLAGCTALALACVLHIGIERPAVAAFRISTPRPANQGGRRRRRAGGQHR